jgi:O-antigen/teichoic acid export membrane protein
MRVAKPRRIWFDVAIYAAGLAIGRLIGFIMIPVYTRALTPSDYGVIEMLSRVADVVALLAGAGISASVIKFYSDSLDEVRARSVVYTATVGIAGVCAVAFAILLPILPKAYEVLNLPRCYHTAGYLMICGALIDVISLVPLAYLRARRRSVAYVVYNLARLFLALCLNILFVVWMQRGVWGITMSSIITSFLSMLVLTGATLRETFSRFNWEVFVNLLRYGLPLVPANVSMFILHNSDRFFLARYHSLDETGVYGLAYRFGAVLSTLIVQPFALMWSVEQFSAGPEKSRGDNIARVGGAVWNVFMASWLLLSVGSHLVLRLMTPSSYWGAIRFIPVILLAYAVFGINHVFQSPLYICGVTSYIAYANAISAVLCLLLNWMLIPPYGGMGAAVATLLSFSSVAGITLFLSHRKMHVHYEWGRMVISLFFAFAGYLLSLSLYRYSIALAILVSASVAFLLGYWAYGRISSGTLVCGASEVATREESDDV